MTQFPAVDYAFSIKSTIHNIYKITQKIQKQKFVQPYFYTAQKPKHIFSGKNKQMKMYYLMIN